jgi:hypothetical protein
MFSSHGPEEARAYLTLVRFWTKADKDGYLARAGLSAYDPSTTLALHCGNDFDAGLRPLSKCSFELIRCCLQ